MTCGYIYQWEDGLVLQLPCAWDKEDHPRKSGHAWQVKRTRNAKGQTQAHR